MSPPLPVGSDGAKQGSVSEVDAEAQAIAVVGDVVAVVEGPAAIVVRTVDDSPRGADREVVDVVVVAVGPVVDGAAVIGPVQLDVTAFEPAGNDDGVANGTNDRPPSVVDATVMDRAAGHVLDVFVFVLVPMLAPGLGRRSENQRDQERCTKQRQGSQAACGSMFEYAFHGSPPAGRGDCEIRASFETGMCRSS
jgi:hypothetical protein